MQQPRIALEIFNRANSGLDIATGLISASSLSCKDDACDGKEYYSTTGPATTRPMKLERPKTPMPACYVLNLGACSEEQRTAYLNGSGIVKDFFLVEFSDGRCVPNPVSPCEIESGGEDGSTGIPQAPIAELNESQWAVTSLFQVIALCMLFGSVVILLLEL
jgi:hypothetical protein